MEDQLSNEGQSAAAPTVLSGVAGRWCSLDECAELIGTKGETLRLFVRGVDGRPVLAHEQHDGRACVQPGPAFDHLKKHSRCRGLRSPYSVGPQAPAQTEYEYEIDPEIRRVLRDRDPFAIDPEELNRILAIGGVPEGTVRVLVQSVRAQQNRRSIELRAGKTFTADEVSKMLRAHAELLVTEVDFRAPALSQKILRMLLTQFNFDLASKTPTAADLLEAQIRDSFGNDVIKQMRTLVEDQVRGVELLELNA